MGMMDMFSGLSISASALRAQRVKQNVIASNLANAETTRTKDGGPYKRQFVVFRENPAGPGKALRVRPRKDEGVHHPCRPYRHPGSRLAPGQGPCRQRRGSGVDRTDQTAPKLIYDPSHPDANEQGYVAMPNVNVVQEMTDMITATRSYEASVTAMNSTKAMLMKALEI